MEYASHRWRNLELILGWQDGRDFQVVCDVDWSPRVLQEDVGLAERA
jgi:hypothetical protein